MWDLSISCEIPIGLLRSQTIWCYNQTRLGQRIHSSTFWDTLWKDDLYFNHCNALSTVSSTYKILERFLKRVFLLVTLQPSCTTWSSNFFQYFVPKVRILGYSQCHKSSCDIKVKGVKIEVKRSSWRFACGDVSYFSWWVSFFVCFFKELFFAVSAPLYSWTTTSTFLSSVEIMILPRGVQ